jgi:hypothetical protein
MDRIESVVVVTDRGNQPEGQHQLAWHDSGERIEHARHARDHSKEQTAPSVTPETVSSSGALAAFAEGLAIAELHVDPLGRADVVVIDERAGELIRSRSAARLIRDRGSRAQRFADGERFFGRRLIDRADGYERHGAQPDIGDLS